MPEKACSLKVSVLLAVVIFQSILLSMYVFDFNKSNYEFPPPSYKVDGNVPPSSVDYTTELRSKEKTRITSSAAIEGLMSIAMKMQKIELHAKSMKALRAVRTANEEMKILFKEMGLNYGLIQARRIETVAKNICPEKYEGHKFGFPLFEKGFTTLDCSYKKPLSSLVTILMISVTKNINVNNLIENAKKFFPDVSIVIGTSYSVSLSSLPNVFIKPNMQGAPGKMWNSLVSEVSTPYVLVARGLTDIDEYANIERLIREKELFNIDIAGGSLRDRDTGHWTIGCYQRAFQNYTLVFQEGYDESQNGCLVCDHIDGPFVIETAKLRDVKFDSSLNVGLFEDLFLRLGYEHALVCPDTMFHVLPVQRPADSNPWREMASKHEIKKIKFIPGFEVSFPCVYPYKCHKGEKNIISPCCIQELNVMTNIVMKFCEKNLIMCELNGGTILAAVKMNMLFPWDVDSDIVFHLANFSLLKSKLTELNNHKPFKTSLSQKPVYKNSAMVLGAYNYNSKYWFVEIWGKEALTTSKLLNKGKNQTKVLLWGTWVGAPANPGAWVRNRYGNYLYFHSEHWRHLGRSDSYKHLPSDQTGHFRQCKTPGNHKCLDNFNAVGNLQFQDPIP